MIGPDPSQPNVQRNYNTLTLKLAYSIRQVWIFSHLSYLQGRVIGKFKYHEIFILQKKYHLAHPGCVQWRLNLGSNLLLPIASLRSLILCICFFLLHIFPFPSLSMEKRLPTASIPDFLCWKNNSKKYYSSISILVTGTELRQCSIFGLVFDVSDGSPAVPMSRLAVS